MSALIVNFFGGPGAGKSTLALGVAHKLKQEGELNCEFVHEFAKELTWEERDGALKNQVWILGSQFEMLRRCEKHVDMIITDTSLLLSAIYCQDSPWADEIAALAFKMFHSMNNITFVVNREKKYNPVGRSQTEQEARIIDHTIRNMLVQQDVPYIPVPGNSDGIGMVLDELSSYWADQQPFDDF